MVTAVPAQALGRTQEGAAQMVIVTHILALFAHGEVRHELIPFGERELLQNQMPRACPVETHVGCYTDPTNQQSWMPRPCAVEVHVLS